MRRLLPLLVFLAACTGETSDPPALVEILPSPPALFLELGEEASVVAVAVDAEGGRSAIEVDWEPSEPGVVEVESGGRIRGIGRGHVRLFARRGEVEAALAIEVVGGASKLQLAPEELRLQPGDSRQLELIARDRYGLGIERAGRFESSAPGIARVSEEGVVEAMGVGEATIMAEADGLVAEARVVVDPLPPHSVEILAPKERLKVGESMELQAIVRNRAGEPIEGVPVHWRSGSSSALHVSVSGVVTPRLPASSAVFATAGEAGGVLWLESYLVYGPIEEVRDWDGENPTLCGLSEEGVAFCHGDNAHDQLGDGTFRARRIPAPVAGAPPFVRLRATVSQPGGYFPNRTFRGITAEGRLFEWGERVQKGFSNRPYEVVDRLDRPWFDDRRLGSYGFDFCELTSRGVALCSFGQAVREGPIGPRTESDPAPEHAPIVQISGNRSFCWRYETGEISCWATHRGGASSGSGFGEPIPLEEPAVDMASGGHSHCALDASGEVRCWRQAFYGSRTGRYFLGISQVLPATVPGPISRLFSGTERVCGLADARLVCWDMEFSEESPLEDPSWLGAPYELDTGELEVTDFNGYLGIFRDADGRHWRLGDPPELLPGQG